MGCFAAAQHDITSIEALWKCHSERPQEAKNLLLFFSKKKQILRFAQDDTRELLSAAQPETFCVTRSLGTVSLISGERRKSKSHPMVGLRHRVEEQLAVASLVVFHLRLHPGGSALLQLGIADQQ